MAKKKTVALVLAFCMLFVPLSDACIQAKTTPSTKKTMYVAFGDSIAAGYGLTGYAAKQTEAPPDSYQALVAEFLHTKQHNYAVSGADSDDCLALLASKKADKDLASADVVTVSIGSNDLLLPFIQIVLSYYGLSEPGAKIEMPADGEPFPALTLPDPMQMYLQSTDLIAALTDNETLHKNAQAFRGKLAAIIARIHKKAPGAEIYVTNIYNPFLSVPLLGELTQTYIDEINRAFSAQDAGYTLVDVATPFAQQELTNVQFDLSGAAAASMDPHPSIEGHRVFANRIIRALKKNNAPGTCRILSAASGSRYKLTLRFQKASRADGYQIRYATSRSGTYRTLANTAKPSFSSNSKTLAPKKTYYVAVRSYRTVLGVTYYGKQSAAKKIKVRY